MWWYYQRYGPEDSTSADDTIMGFIVGEECCRLGRVAGGYIDGPRWLAAVGPFKAICDS
jgi:hypothetical protein